MKGNQTKELTNLLNKKKSFFNHWKDNFCCAKMTLFKWLLSFLAFNKDGCQWGGDMSSRMKIYKETSYLASRQNINKFSGKRFNHTVTGIKQEMDYLLFLLPYVRVIMRECTQFWQKKKQVFCIFILASQPCTRAVNLPLCALYNSTCLLQGRT